MSKIDPSDKAAKLKTAVVTTTGNVAKLPAKIKAQRPSDKVVSFVKRHPVIVVAGGIAVGAAVSTLIPRGTTRRWFSRAAKLAETAGATSLLYGREAGDKAQELGHDASEKASLLAKQAEKAGSAAAESLEKYGLAALAAAASLGRATARKATELGDVAAEQSSRALQKAQKIRDRIGH